ncbi:MAG TPA: 2-phosphosulfolactate phosphatase [Glaciibacter sp.]|nr:2-phosphosulfolactate phosphatase [Glaciibacter sp.]
MSDALAQHIYQVRFEWGVSGFQALAGHSDVVVLADALPSVERRGSDGSHATALGAHRVIAANFGNRAAVADWVLQQQTEKGGRLSVAVIAIGESRPDGSLRLAVEDLLVAGAVIDAFAGIGIDHCSPEAAAASAAFVGLKRALRHLLTGSESGQAFHAMGSTRLVQEASVLDNSTEVTELHEFSFPG